MRCTTALAKPGGLVKTAECPMGRWLHSVSNVRVTCSAGHARVLAGTSGSAVNPKQLLMGPAGGPVVIATRCAFQSVWWRVRISSVLSLAPSSDPPQSVQRVCDRMGPICSAKNCWLLSVHIPVATSGAGDAHDGDASPTVSAFAHRELSTAQHLGEDRPAEKLSRTPRGSTAQSARCLHAARSQATSPVPRARAGCRGC